MISTQRLSYKKLRAAKRLSCKRMRVHIVLDNDYICGVYTSRVRAQEHAMGLKVKYTNRRDRSHEISVTTHKIKDYKAMYHDGVLI